MVHDIPKLIQYRGGNVRFIQSLDDHFNGGHNDHTNEVRLLLFYLLRSLTIRWLDVGTDRDRIIIALASYSLPILPCWRCLQISRKSEGDSTREL